MTDKEAEIKEVMTVINEAMLNHFEADGNLDPNLVMNVLLNLIVHYSDLLDVDPGYILQQGIDNFGHSKSTSLGGVDIEFE